MMVSVGYYLLVIQQFESNQQHNAENHSMEMFTVFKYMESFYAFEKETILFALLGRPAAM